MTKHSKNETCLQHAFFLRQTKIRQEMNIFVSPSNNFLLAKGIKSISTQFDQKKNKNKILKIMISFCGQTLVYWAPC